MSAIVAEVALPVFAFYLLVACNFIKEIFGCRLQHVLDHNIIAKHIIAFLLLFFLVVIINPEYADQHILRNLAISVGIYVWFLITSRAPFYIMIPVLILLIASYIASIAKKRNETTTPDPNAAKRAQMIQYGLANGAFVLSLIGFAIYAIEKRREYAGSFSWLKFFSGNLKCRGYTPKHAKLWH
jgi:hypothetical protein